MFSLKITGKNRVDMEFSGKIDSAGMRQVLDEFEDKLEGMDNVRMLYRIENFQMPTFGAMMVKMGELPSLLKLMKRFDKIAILADKTWIQKVADLEGCLFPGLDIKGFDLDRGDDAEAWLA
ncbi:STAS/SEC14 domain-containing protein [Rubritalea profundi]|uniref:STAS/SEC14 domain-containing protein n=1 Tax=Rubritalea profundi TaxID=1658618 RepID=A0A2S7TYG1_9BACT|nr:STAS/SEC14 domain-containing protein [Rubritalea profundi]PQJ27251.1 hypothetical protein BSZ32_01230 [Rubritalea profundi]